MFFWKVTPRGFLYCSPGMLILLTTVLKKYVFSLYWMNVFLWMNRIVRSEELDCCALTLRKGSLVIVKFQRSRLNESLEHEEVSNNRCDPSKLQCANSCSGFIIFQFVFHATKKRHPVLSGCSLRVWGTCSILKNKLLSSLFALGGYEKTTCHCRNLVKKAEIKDYSVGKVLQG